MQEMVTANPVSGSVLGGSVLSAGPAGNGIAERWGVMCTEMEEAGSSSLFLALCASQAARPMGSSRR